METIKEALFQQVEVQKQELAAMSDWICDHPEVGTKEVEASRRLCDYLKAHGFSVAKGLAGFATAFRAEYSVGSGNGHHIGLLCEYDALEGVGHGCGHHMQGPAIIGAAVALARTLPEDMPCKIIVYGTPAEETLGAKVPMLADGCFRDLDIALMTHASGSGTCVDNKTLALREIDVQFFGKQAHAAISPDKGRSALDAMLLSFQGIEFLREHVPDDIRMHYCIPEAVSPVNVVPDHAVGKYALRGYSAEVLDSVVKRFHKIIEGACLMTETTYEIKEHLRFDNAIGVDALRDALMANAKLVGAPDLRPPRSKTGSTDFGTVLHQVPGACMRIDCGVHGFPGHSKELAAAGKNPSFHEGIAYAAKILAATGYDFLVDDALRDKIKEEFAEKRVQ